MAIAATNLTTAGDATDATSYTSASITPTANRLVLAWFVATQATTALIPTVTGNGLTWVLVTTRIQGTRTMSLFRAMGSSPSTGAVTFDLAGTTHTGAEWSIVEFSDVNTSGTNGAGAIANKSVNSASGGTSLITTLTAFSDTDDATAAAFFHAVDEATTVGGGLTGVAATNQASPGMSLASGFVASNDTSVSASWTGTSANIGIAVAIRHSASAVVPQIYNYPAAMTVAAGAITPPIPPGTIIGDLMIMLCETSAAAITASGWTEASDSPQTPDDSSTRLTVFYRYATTNDLTDASTTSDSGNHNFGMIFGVMNSIGSGDPFNVTAGGVDNTSDTSGSIPGDTTTTPNTLVVAATVNSTDAVAGSTQFSGWTNADLDSLQEFFDNMSASGDGGGIGAAFGWKFSAGSYTTTDVTYANASEKGMWSGAIKPFQDAPTVVLNSPADASSDSDTTPTLDFTGTDIQTDSIEYQVQIDTVNTFDSGGAGGTATYYFDTSDGGPTDADAVWTDDANAFDGSTSTRAIPSANGTTSSNYLLGEGTNAPASGGNITQVRARIYGGTGLGSYSRATIYTDALGESLGEITVQGASNPGYGPYLTLSTPSGGWSWAKLQALEVKIYQIVSSGTVYRVEVEVTSDDIPLHNKLSVTPDAGFVNPDTGGDTHPFNSGENIQFTVQAGDALAAGTYYWRVRGLDPAGSNTYGDWSSTRSFTVTGGTTTSTSSSTSTSSTSTSISTSTTTSSTSSSTSTTTSQSTSTSSTSSSTSTSVSTSSTSSSISTSSTSSSTSLSTSSTSSSTSTSFSTSTTESFTTSTSSTSSSISTSSTSSSISTSSTSSSTSTSISTSSTSSSTSTSISTSSTSSSISTTTSSTSSSISTTTSFSTSSTSTSITTSTSFSTSSTSSSISTSSTSSSISTSSTSSSISTSSTSSSTSLSTSTTTTVIDVRDFTGFELGDVQDAHATSGTISVQSTIKDTGDYALRVNPTAGTGYYALAWIQSNGLTVSMNDNTIGATARIRIATAPDVATVVMRLVDAIDVDKQAIRLNTDRTLTLLNGATEIGSPSGALALDTWYTISLRGTRNATTGTAGAALNGVEFAADTGLNTGTSSLGSVRIGAMTSCTTDLYFDNFWTADEDAYPPYMVVKNMRPDAVGTNDEWSNTFAEVDEIPISESDYRESTAADSTFVNNLESSATRGISGTIKSIKGWSWGEVSDATGTYGTRIRQGALSDTSSQRNSETAEFRSRKMDFDFSGDELWTTTDLDEMQVGAHSTTAPGADQNIRVYAVGLMVLYDDGGGTTTSTSSTSSSTSTTVSTSTSSTSSSTSISTSSTSQSTSTSISTSSTSSSTSTSFSTSSTSSSISTSSTSSSISTSTTTSFSTSTSTSTSSTSSSTSISTSSTSSSTSTSISTSSTSQSTSTSISTSSTSSSTSISTSSTSSSTSTSISTSSTSSSTSTSFSTSSTSSSTSTSFSTSSTSTSFSTSTSTSTSSTSSSTSISTSSTSSSISTSSTSSSTSVSTSTSTTDSITTSTSSTSSSTSLSTSSTSSSTSTTVSTSSTSSSTSTTQSTSTSSTSTSFSTSSTSQSTSTSFSTSSTSSSTSTTTSQSTSSTSSSTSTSFSTSSTSSSTSLSTSSTSSSTSTSFSTSSTSQSTSTSISTSTTQSTSTSTSSTSTSASSTSSSTSTSTTLPPDIRSKPRIIIHPERVTMGQSKSLPRDDSKPVINVTPDRTIVEFGEVYY